MMDINSGNDCFRYSNNNHKRKYFNSIVNYLI